MDYPSEYYPMSSSPPPSPFLKNPNLTTIIFLIICLGISIIALIFAVIAYIYYTNLKNQRVELVNNVQKEDIISTSISVVTDPSLITVQFQYLLNNPPVIASSNGSGILAINFKKYGADNVTIGNYPFSNVNNLVTVTMPLNYASIMGIIIPSGVTNEYLFSDLWIISNVYRTMNPT